MPRVANVKILPLIIVSIILFGISAFLRKEAVDRIHPYQIQIISAAVYVALLPLWISLSYKEGYTSYDKMGVLFTVLLVTTSTIASVAFGFALKQTNSPGVVAALVSLSPVITMSLSILFLHESLSTTKVVAFLLALASAILVNL